MSESRTVLKEQIARIMGMFPNTYSPTMIHVLLTNIGHRVSTATVETSLQLMWRDGVVERSYSPLRYKLRGLK